MVSALGFTSLSVRPTNLLINLIAPLGGVYGYFKEKRLSGLLALSACVGGVPGSLLGAWIGLRFLKDPGLFKVVIGLLLIGMASRLFYETTDRYLSTRKRQQELKTKFEARVKAIRAKIDSASEAGITSTTISPWRVTIRFWDEDFHYNPALVVLAGFFSAVLGVMTGMGAAFILVPIMTSPRRSHLLLYHEPILHRVRRSPAGVPLGQDAEIPAREHPPLHPGKRGFYLGEPVRLRVLVILIVEGKFFVLYYSVAAVVHFLRFF